MSWVRVSADLPCPVCRRPDWCSISADGAVAKCMRQEDGCFRSKEDRNGTRYYLHRLAGGPPPAAPSPPRAGGPRPKRAAPDTLNSVYTALLARLTLGEAHRATLKQRGLTPDEIDRRGYRTLPARGRAAIVRELREQFGPDVLLTVPGFAVRQGRSGRYLTLRGPAGLLVPCRDLAGRVVALKVRRDAHGGEGPKYVYVSSARHGGPGSGAPAHVPLGTPETAELVRVTEGELKADVLYARTGLPTLAAPGVTNWRPCLEVLKALNCSAVRMAFDADAAANPTVAQALSACADALTAAGYSLELEHWDMADAKGLDDLLVAGKTPEVARGDAAVALIRQTVERATGSPPGHSRADVRPTILITTEEHLVNDQAVAALARDPAIFQRGGLLVRVIRDVSPAAKGVRRPFAPRIEPLPPPLLRESLAAGAYWFTVRETADGPEQRPARPPAWCVAAVHARAHWPGVRHLEAVVDYPVLRPDGTVFDRRGYDAETGLLLEPAGELPAAPDRPTRDDAVAAREALLEVVADFPFERDVHRAAWLAGLLTPLARFAFVGPAPLFLVDSNVRGAGKGLLLDCISRVVTGERFTVATYTGEEEELRKRITSLALSGDRLVLFDNLEGKFGNAVLDAALTGTAWKDRVLGANRMAEAPLYMSWYATGNNVSIAADTARRVCHVRLESPEERPEERHDFRQPNLLGWVGENRGRLLAAALTILRAYCAAGRPDQGLPAWGSFEGWSGLVRSAVVWAGLPDPGETRLLLQEQADVAAEAMAVLLACWEQMDPDRRGLTAAEVIQRLYKEPPDPPPDHHADFKVALEALLGRPDSRGLGNRLRSYRRRVFQGRFIDQAGTEQRAARWAVYPASAFRRGPGKTHQTHRTHPRPGESGESGESCAARAGTAPALGREVFEL